MVCTAPVQAEPRLSHIAWSWKQSPIVWLSPQISRARWEQYSSDCAWAAGENSAADTIASRVMPSIFIMAISFRNGASDG
jgi:hypothetical protein